MTELQNVRIQLIITRAIKRVLADKIDIATAVEDTTEEINDWLDKLLVDRNVKKLR